MARWGGMDGKVCPWAQGNLVEGNTILIEFILSISEGQAISLAETEEHYQGLIQNS